MEPISEACANPAEVVYGGLRATDVAMRAQFLRAVMAHAAAALVLIEDERCAAEAAYRVGDIIASQRGR